MPGDDEAGARFGVELEWPSDHLAGDRLLQPADPDAEADDTGGAHEDPGFPIARPAVPLDDVPRALAAIVARLDSLATATTLLRTITAARLDDHRDDVARTLKGLGDRLEAGAASRERTIVELRRKLVRQDQQLSALTESFERMSSDVARMTEELVAVRRRLPVRSRDRRPENTDTGARADAGDGDNADRPLRSTARARVGRRAQR